MNVSKSQSTGRSKSNDFVDVISLFHMYQSSPSNIILAKSFHCNRSIQEFRIPHFQFPHNLVPAIDRMKHLKQKTCRLSTVL